MREMQLIYASRPFGYDELMLAGILSSARRNNSRDGITGALICREDLFVQLLEGPRDVVTAAYARILQDDRHVDVEQAALHVSPFPVRALPAPRGSRTTPHTAARPAR